MYCMRLLYTTNFVANLMIYEYYITNVIADVRCLLMGLCNLQTMTKERQRITKGWTNRCTC